MTVLTDQCSYSDCDRPVHGRGLCQGHWRQHGRGEALRPLRRYGTFGQQSSPAERERVAEMWRLFADEGLTYAEIGDAFGVTRERVRQVLVARYGNGLMGLVRFRREARRRHAAYLDSRWATCVVCGTVFRSRAPRESRWACCPEHVPYQAQIRTTCDPVRHEAHQRYVATAHARRGKAYERSWREVHPGRTRFRWLTAGSSIHALMTEAWAKGWPIVARLPEEIREQLAAEADGERG